MKTDRVEYSTFSGWVDPPVARNDVLVGQVRGVVARDALPNRIYARLKRERLPDVKEFTIAEKGLFDVTVRSFTGFPIFSAAATALVKRSCS